MYLMLLCHGEQPGTGNLQGDRCLWARVARGPGHLPTKSSVIFSLAMIIQDPVRSVCQTDSGTFHCITPSVH